MLSPRPTTLDGLFEAASELWKAIPQSVIDKTVDSMEKRILAFKAARGFVTKY